jgi:hypothetical protein
LNGADTIAATTESLTFDILLETMPIPSKRRLAMLFLCLLGKTGAFLTISKGFRSVVVPQTTLTLPSSKFSPTAHPMDRRPAHIKILHAANNGAGAEQSSLNFNPLYGALWILFLGFGLFLSPGELLDPTDTIIIEGFINDPSNASGAMNPLFFAVFNALGVMPIVMAQLILPQGSKQGVPAAPFLLGSFAAGYGSAGLYLTLRAPPVNTKNKTEASWITANVMDNKIANWIVVALCGSVVVTSGILSSPDGLTNILESYQLLASTSKLVSVSSVDLLILNVVAATLIPQDYRLRKADGEGKNGMVSLMAASTVLLPVIGAAVYCALRPPLPEE